MNKKILTVIISIAFILMFILYIGAEENSTPYEDIIIQNQEIVNQIPSQDIVYEDLDSLNESLLPIIIEEENLTESEENISNEESPNLEETITQISISNNNNDNKEENNETSIEYVELSNLTKETTEENSEEIIQEKTSYVYYVDGRKEIEIESYERIEINKEEIEKNEFEKEITISSEQHVEDPLRVYTDLTTEAKKEEIKIYWQNQDNLDITDENEFAVEYYDENGNGLIDRISWMVPHLSTQIFDVVIEVTQVGTNNVLWVDVISYTATNPISFEIDVDYADLNYVNCSLSINSSPAFVKTFNITNNPLVIGTPTLENGNYHWEVMCFNTSNSSTLVGDFGDFTIAETSNLFDSSGNWEESEIKTFFLNLTEPKIIKNREWINLTPYGQTSNRIEIKLGGNTIYNQSTSQVLLNEVILNQPGNYTLTAYFDYPSARTNLSRNFSVVGTKLTINATSIKEGESVNITANITSSKKRIVSWRVLFGDATPPFYSETYPASPINQYIIHKYTNEGTYIVSLDLTLEGGETFNLQKTLTVTDSTDNEDPDITLLWPKDERTIYVNVVNFSYQVYDNVKLQNCTFRLYNADCVRNWSLCSTNSIEYTAPIKNTPLNNEEIEIKLKDFDEGIYGWGVECYDNSSNKDDEINFFKIDLNGTSLTSSSDYDYTQKEEVDLLKEQIDEFLGEDFTLEELEVLEDLNILNDTKYYKKRLVDIGNFLGENYKYVQSEELREKKTNEYLAELENIKNKVPQNILIKESYEFIKNRIDIDLELVIQDYFDSTNTNIGRASVQKLAKVNKELQNGVTVSAKIRNIEIEYNNGTQKITLVKKKIDFEEDGYSKILEIIPKNIAKDSDEIIFITDSEVVKKDPIFEMDYEDLDRGQVIYYLRGFSDLKDFEKTETLLFEDDLSKIKARVTGFFVVDFTSSDTALYFIIAFILLIALSFFGIFVFKKFRMLSWRKEPNVVRTIHLLEEIKKLLAEKRVEEAREKYYKIKEIYPLLPYKTRIYFYTHIKEMLVRIDRKDIMGLVKEYQEAKKTWNKDAYVRLYKDIKKIYERLPEKDRKKVYDIINGY